MSMYVKSKSKTGKVPRTGNRYFGDYRNVDFYPPEGGFYNERIFLLVGLKAGRVNAVAFNSVAAAKRAGWVKV